jgi:uncharacterized protein with PIN domain
MKKSRDQLKKAFMLEVEELFDELMDWDDETQEPDLTQIEEKVLELRKRFGEQIAQQVLLRQEARQPSARVKCPDCGGEMVPKGMKDNRVETRFGDLPLRRGYYYCPDCQEGLFPPGSAVEDLGETLE